MPLIATLVPLDVQFDVQSTTEVPGLTYEHVVDDVSFTHFVTAYAGGIDAAQIMPAMIKCFFILNLLFIANEKTTKIFQVVGGS